MPRLTSSSPFDGELFADTQVIDCTEHTSGVAAQAYRFSSTLGNFHAIDQWTKDVPIWWDPPNATLTIGELVLAKGDYVVDHSGGLIRLAPKDFAEKYRTQDGAPAYGGAYAGPSQ